MATRTAAQRARSWIRAALYLAALVALPLLATPASATRATAKFPVKSVLGLDAPLEPGDYVWDDEGVAPGKTTIVVDLETALIHVYRAGNEIGRSSIIYGFDAKPTPLGVYPILQKSRDHVSNIYKGAPMPWMLRLTWTGIAIHGSRRIADDIATHGCVGLPHGFAKILFDNAKVGDTVMVTNSWSGNDDAIRMAEAAQPTPQPAPVLDYAFPIDTPADDAAMLSRS
ncbi:L,D-transpeptidase family protein [Hephaestia sp. GCM10023244]|uniref:L,D-transpeptidase family protein n=1 Tax=unclassified Hephaestia TaxID=2631281 RepID=UPI002076FB3F|nr:L,D-transpeptidase family protein [Hephaestia sp. MAHUQ-44]MCM8730033.1 L,D-transpeptidase family protein [Hephaestia sp. MAHUQ-44]